MTSVSVDWSNTANTASFALGAAFSARIGAVDRKTDAIAISFTITSFVGEVIAQMSYDLLKDLTTQISALISFAFT